MEQGATTMPRVLNEPEDTVAPMLRTWCTSCAKASTCATVKSVSAVSVMRADSEMMRCVCTSLPCSACRMRMP